MCASAVGPGEEAGEARPRAGAGFGASALGWAVAGALAAAATAFHVGHSLASGALALPPTYDDVAYFLDAAIRLDIIERSGLEGFLADYARRPPHSPAMSLLAMAGFAVFGIKPWAACAVMAVPLTLILRAGVALSRDLPLWLAAVLLIPFLGAPLADILVVEFRPDALCGIVTAFGALYIVLGPWSGGATHPALMAGVLLGLALLIKPTVFPITMILFGVAMVAAGSPRVFRREGVGRVVRSAVITALAGAAVAAPHYVVGFENTLRYLIDNLLGELSDVWKRERPPFVHAFYYLTGEGGGFTMGAWLYTAPVAAGACLALELRAGKRGAGATVARVLAVVLACFVVVSASAHKSPFIGIALPSLLMLILFVSLLAIVRRLLRSPRPAGAALVPAALLAFAVAEFSTPWARHGEAPVTPGEASNRQRMLAETIAALRAEVPDGGRVVLVAISHYLHATLLKFTMVQMQRRPPDISSFHLYGSPDKYRAALAQADVALALAPDADAIPWLPSPTLRQTFLDDLRRNSKWRLVRTIYDASGKGPLYLFRRDTHAAQ